LPTEKGFDFVHEGRFNTYWANHTLDGKPIEKQQVEIPGYRLKIQTQAAVTFINKNKEQPFLLLSLLLRLMCPMMRPKNI